MAKIPVLHIVWLGLVASVTLQRPQNSWEEQVTQPAYQGQAIEKEVPDESLELYVQGGFKSLPTDLDNPHRFDDAPELPKSIQGRNLIFAGDHVDRDAVKHICTRYGAKMTTFSDLRSTESVAGRKFVHAPAKGSRSNHLLCHLDWLGQNVSLMYLWHPGVMSTPPHSPWHQNELKTTWKKYLYTTEVQGKKLWVENANDLAKIYWRKAIYDHLPNRPTILVTQSSYWDTALAMGFLRQIKPARPIQLYQEGLEDLGWDAYQELDAWNWTQHATSYMIAAKQGLSPEKVVWRTQANCPVAAASDGLDIPFADSQAEIVRSQIQLAVTNEHEGELKERHPDDPDVSEVHRSWSGVKIMDWREVYDSRKGDGCDGEDGTSYTQQGYESYMKTLWHTLDDEGHAADL